MAEIGDLDLEKINRFFFPMDLASFVADLIVIISCQGQRTFWAAVRALS